MTGTLSMLAAAAVMALGVTPALAQGVAKNMSFFIASQGSGKGADLGGLAGADRLCQTLASAAGSTNKSWRAYLSAAAADGKPAVNARDRIGKGPWRNAKGYIIAHNLAELHGDANMIEKETALNEKGEVVKGTGDRPNTHDILTGSNPDGTLMGGGENMTCNNWTGSGAGKARLGHHDRVGRVGPGLLPESWNSAHDSIGCGQDDLVRTGGAGLIYCFAR